MRKNEMRAVMEALKKRNSELASDRRDELAALHEKADKLARSLAAIQGDVKAHGRDLAKHGEDLSGLAESVRASLLRQSEPAGAPEPEAPAKAVTPITAKRGTKAAG
jgi:hypothetical protein